MRIQMKNILRTAGMACLAALMVSVVSCKKGPTGEDYAKGLADIAAEYNKNCPKEQAEGVTLESVTFADNDLTFRLSVTDQAILGVDLDLTRDSLIASMSDKMKKFLVKGQCNVVYKYVSPNDSSSITIVPNEVLSSMPAETGAQ